MKRDKFKSNKALALFLCGLLLLVSIGLAYARANKGVELYQARDLVLAQGQSDYDLMNGIYYDQTQYVLTVTDEGGFDINTPGTYQVHYRLTPAGDAAVPLPLPKPPAGTESQGPGSAAPKPDVSDPALDSSADQPGSLSKPEQGAPAKPEAPVKPEQSAPAKPEAPVKPEQSAPAKTEAVFQPNHRASSPEAGPSAKLEDRGAVFASSNLSIGSVGYGMTSENGNPIGAVLASNRDISKTGDSHASKKSDSTLISPKPDKQPSAESHKPAPSPESSKESEKQSGVESDKTAPSPEPSKESDKQSGVESHKPAPSPEPSKESDKQSGVESDKPAPSPEPSKEPDKQPSAQPDKPASPEPSKEPDKQSSAQPDKPASPEPSKGPDQQSGTPDALAPQPESAAEPIDFSRNVVVNPAVIYQDIRMDIHTTKDLLTGMTYNAKVYEVKVSDDGGFLPGRIGEYKITYELSNVSDPDQPRKIGQLQRYVWITAQGVQFDAKPLTVDVSKDYDLLADIQYDSTKYNLSLVDPNAFDQTSRQPQRVMYRLTLKTNTAADGKANSSDQNASPLEAAVFGREVTVAGGVKLQIDAPPLIVTQGALQTVNLLEGVTVKDEKGNPVDLKVKVVDRSQLDAGIKAAESAEPPARADNALTKKETDQAAAPAHSSENQSPSVRADMDGPKLTSMPALFSLMAMPDQTAKPPVIELSADATLPPNLAPGTYTVYLGLDSAATGANYKPAPRMLYVGYASSMLKLIAPAGSGITTPMGAPQGPIASLLKMYASKIKDHPGKYTFALNREYTINQADVDALSKYLADLGSDYTFTFTGIDPDGNPQRIFTLIFPNDLMGTGDTGLRLPASADSSKTAQFVIENIKLQFQENLYIAAQGSKLTMGKGIKLAGINGAGTYVLGGYKDYADPSGKPALAPALNSDVTVISGGGTRDDLGIYTSIAGGNFKTFHADDPMGMTIGTTKVTIAGSGSSPQISSVTGGGTGTVDKHGKSSGQQNMEGSSAVSVSGGKISTVYGGTRGVQTNRAGQTDTSQVSVTGGNIGSVYGGGESADVGEQLVSSSVDLSGGTITNACGGSYGKMGTADAPAVSYANVRGTATITGTVYGSAYGWQQYGAATVNISGGKVKNAMGADMAKGSGEANVNITGGTVTGDIAGSGYRFAGAREKKCNINIDTPQDITVETVHGFDLLKIKDGLSLTVTNQFSNKSGPSTFDGIIQLGEKSVLNLDNGSTNYIGGFDVPESSGAILGLRRQSNSNSAPVVLTSPMTSDLPKDALTLTFVGAGKDDATTGDKIMKFEFKAMSPSAAYTKGFRPDFAKGLLLTGDTDPDSPTGGFIFLTHTVSLTTTDSAGSQVSYYGSVADAMNAIGSGTDDYTVTIRRAGYQFTDKDGSAIADQGKLAKHITFTGQYTTTAEDVLGTGQMPGQTVSVQTVQITPEGMQGHLPVISFTADTNVENLRLDYQVTGGAIFANGHKLIVNSKVEIVSTASYFPVLYGGSATADVKNTDLELHGGSFSGIYGGGKNGNVEGNTTLKIDGGGLYGALYGGGDAGDVTGTASIEIGGGDLLAATPAKGENQIIGGGRTGSAGACSIKIYGGNANGRTDVAGCDQGNITKNVSIDIAKSPDPEHEIHMPFGNVYGGGMEGGIVGGSVSIQLDGGTDYGVISGGGDPSYLWADGVTAYSSVKGDKTITLLGGNQGRIEMEDVVNFTDCNLGRNGANNTSVNLKGRLDSNESLSDTNPFGRTGNLNFYNGSVLNLGDAKQTGQSPKVGNITVSAPGSHLHIYKTDTGVTYPICISGKTVNSNGARLTLGVLSDAADKGKMGDVLARFAQKGSLQLDQYLSDSQSLELVAGKEGDTIEYGAQDYPTAALDFVVQNQPDENLPGKITKTLHFTFSGKSEANPDQGSPLASAYVDTNPIPNWGADGSIPTDALGQITFKDDPYEWTGSMDPVPITEPTDANPIYYFLHLRTKDNAAKTVVLDVDSPKSVATCKVNRDGNGTYTFHLIVQDKPTPAPQGVTLNYMAFGLSQAAWTLGDAGGPAHPEAVTAALNSPDMTASPYLHDITDISGGKFAPWEVTFRITPEELAEIPGALKDKVVFFLIKDKGGNTRQIAVPMSESIIDVAIPSRVGVIALKDNSPIPRVLAPVCYVRNHGPSKVRAEIVGVDFPPSQQGELTYTKRKAPGTYGADEIDLEITQANDTPGGASSRTGAFQSTSVKDISESQTLLLGEMAGRTITPSSSAVSNSSGTGDASPTGSARAAEDPSAVASASSQPAEPFVDFTFLAQFNPAIVMTNSWSICSLNYRFTLVPSSQPSVTVEMQRKSGEQN